VTFLDHKINGIIILGDPHWQIPIITLWGNKIPIYVGYGPYGHVIYKTTRNREGDNIMLKVSSWGTYFYPFG
jgi:hypothetical protein